MNEYVKINVTLTPEILRGLGTLKQRDGSSVSWSLRKAAEAYLRAKGLAINAPNKSR